MAAGQEIKGSRRTHGHGKQRFATRLFISDDGSTGVPAAGDDYPGDSGITARVCVGAPTVEPEVIPGIFYHAAQYVGFIAYT